MYKFRTFLLSLGVCILSLGLPIHAAYSQTSDGKITELVKTDTKLGDGIEALFGDTVQVRFTGWVYDEAAQDHKGKGINPTQNRANPVKVKLGAGRAIKGLDQGIVGMKIGGLRTILVPPNMGYGEVGEKKLGIPTTAGLMFEIELIDVEPATF